MRYSAIAILFCALNVFQSVVAQDKNKWIEVSSDAEYFRVSMPQRPKEQSLTVIETNYGKFDVKGKSYDASADGATYALWALTAPGDINQHRSDPDSYLDASAELIWEGLLKSARDQLPDDRRARAAMTYVKELSKPLPGREYSVTIGDVTGITDFYVTESRIYVLLAMGVPNGGWTMEPFLESFAISPNLPGQLSTNEAPIGSGKSAPDTGAAETGPVFRSSELTQRARVLEKPEPTYTESARKFSIQGTVVLRAVFSRNGEVTNIHVMRKLPHGLTEKALNAARRIRFIPAVKDGQPVSMWMQLEYNFNLY
jgi:TonB family protein